MEDGRLGVGEPGGHDEGPVGVPPPLAQAIHGMPPGEGGMGRSGHPQVRPEEHATHRRKLLHHGPQVGPDVGQRPDQIRRVGRQPLEDRIVAGRPHPGESIGVQQVEHGRDPERADGAERRRDGRRPDGSQWGAPGGDVAQRPGQPLGQSGLLVAGDGPGVPEDPPDSGLHRSGVALGDGRPVGHGTSVPDVGPHRGPGSGDVVTGRAER